MYKQGYNYKRAGVILSGIVKADQQQKTLFNDDLRHEKFSQIMAVVDKLNAVWGSNTVRSAAQGMHKKGMNSDVERSFAYTTRWEDLLVVKI